MDLLIHATLTITGAREQLPAADARIKALLVEEIFVGEFEEHHGEDALSYDFKVHGGIPFPAFAAASLEFPELKIAAEWVNVAAGRKGRALLTNGAIAEHVEEAMKPATVMCWLPPTVRCNWLLRWCGVIAGNGRGMR
jgi:hypothetical protein